MKTYAQIQEAYKVQYGKTIKSCWIADVKRKMGFKMRKAYNRIGDSVMNICPNEIIESRIKNIISDK